MKYIFNQLFAKMLYDLPQQIIIQSLISTQNKVQIQDVPIKLLDKEIVRFVYNQVMFVCYYPKTINPYIENQKFTLNFIVQSGNQEKIHFQTSPCIIDVNDLCKILEIGKKLDIYNVVYYEMIKFIMYNRDENMRNQILEQLTK